MHWMMGQLRCCHSGAVGPLTVPLPGYFVVSRGRITWTLVCGVNGQHKVHMRQTVSDQSDPALDALQD